jgi:hypothetical protein
MNISAVIALIQNVILDVGGTAAAGARIGAVFRPGIASLYSQQETARCSYAISCDFM